MSKLVKSSGSEAPEKIKQAAHRLFLEKGFGSTSVRDIAELSTTNVALVNYHFGSKNQLYEVVMYEKVKEFFGQIRPIFMDELTTLEQKVALLAEHYIDFLIVNSDMVVFILNETRKNNFEFLKKTDIGVVLRESVFIKQLQDASPIANHLQLMFSLIGMILFPFAGQPILRQTGLVSDPQFVAMMQERKQLIPLWFKSMLTVTP